MTTEQEQEKINKRIDFDRFRERPGVIRPAIIAALRLRFHATEGFSCLDSKTAETLFLIVQDALMRYEEVYHYLVDKVHVYPDEYATDTEEWYD